MFYVFFWAIPRRLTPGDCPEENIKHSVSVRKTNQLKLYREIITVYSEIHTKHINTAVWAERRIMNVNPLNPELIPICYLLALLAHHFLHVSRIRVKSLTIKLLMSYIYGVPILDVSRSHTTTQHSR